MFETLILFGKSVLTAVFGSIVQERTKKAIETAVTQDPVLEAQQGENQQLTRVLDEIRKANETERKRTSAPITVYDVLPADPQRHTIPMRNRKKVFLEFANPVNLRVETPLGLVVRDNVTTYEYEGPTGIRASVVGAETPVRITAKD